MSFETLGENIQHCEGEIFKTLRGISYSYTYCTDYILINNDKRRRISKQSFKTALLIENTSPSKISMAGLWGSSYIYGIITDSRIKNKKTISSYEI